MSGNKTSYVDIVIYMIAVLALTGLWKFGYVSHDIFITLFVAALTLFALYNLRFKIRKIFKRKITD